MTRKIWPAWMRCSFQAALPTAITCAPAQSHAFSPVMQAVQRFAAGGGLVLGICNGFQILTEAGLLPGALMRNAGLKYICKQVHLRVETTDSPFTNQLVMGQVLQIPIGHMEGNYFCTPEELHQLEKRRPHRLPLCHPRWRNHAGSKSKRLVEQHRRHPQCGAQRARHDAPPRPFQREAPRLLRRLEDLRLHDFSPCQPLILAPFPAAPVAECAARSWAMTVPTHHPQS
jgi:hypothetical protein